MTTATVNIHISADTAENALAQARALGGSAGLATIDNDALLAELRERMAKMDPPMVVRVEPFETPTIGKVVEGAATMTPKRGRRPTVEKAPEPVSTGLSPGTTEAVVEEPKPIEPGTQAEGGGDDCGDGAKPLTLDDVKAALNECGAIHGQAATRGVMQEHGGAARLMDVKPEKFDALVAALKKKAAEKPAAQAA